MSVTLIIGMIAFCGMLVAQRVGKLPTIWPANGVLLGILLTSRPSARLTYLLSGFAANILAVWLAGYSAAFFIRLPLINLVEISLALILLRPYSGGEIDLSDLKSLLGFTLIAAIIAPLISVSLNMCLLLLSNGSANKALFVAAFFAHALGIVMTAPLVITVRQGEIAELFNRHRLMSRLLAFGFLLATTTYVFAQTRYPFLFLVYPPLVLVVVLSGFSGGAVGLLLATGIAISFTVFGRGPATLIHASSGIERIIVVQLFLSVAALLVLVLSAILAERDRAQSRLQFVTEQLAGLASTDGLTGLANRRKLDEVLDSECRRARRDRAPISLLLIDVDYFKAFNDLYGHLAGDACLRQIAMAVAAYGHRPGDVSARYGGEEFAVLLSPGHILNAEMIAEDLREDIQALALYHAGNMANGAIVTVSIGVATYEVGSIPVNPDELVSMADTLLYEAKRLGRNRVISTAMMATGRDKVLRSHILPYKAGQ